MQKHKTRVLDINENQCRTEKHKGLVIEPQKPRYKGRNSHITITTEPIQALISYQESIGLVLQGGKRS
ncbi:hypothetical protein DsansV1_C18g0150831 [Dioscorea sansibarensis]